MHLLEVYFEVPLLIVFLRRGYFKVNYIVGKLKWDVLSWWSFRPISAWGSIGRDSRHQEDAAHFTCRIIHKIVCVPGVLIFSSMKYNAWKVLSQFDFCGDGKLSVNWKTLPYPRDTRGQAIIEVVDIKFIPWVTDIFQIDIKFVVAWFRKGCSLTNPITSIWILAFKMLHF